MEELQKISQMTQDEARQVLMAEVEKEAHADMARIIRQIEAEARDEGEKRARKLISLAIQRVASDHVAEITSSAVALPSEEMKGRIIGRNGRNIRSFEQATFARSRRRPASMSSSTTPLNRSPSHVSIRSEGKWRAGP